MVKSKISDDDKKRQNDDRGRVASGRSLRSRPSRLLKLDDRIGQPKRPPVSTDNESTQISSASASADQEQSGTVSFPLDALKNIYSQLGDILKNGKPKESEYINDDSPMVEVDINVVTSMFSELCLGETDTTPPPNVDVNVSKIIEQLQKVMKNEHLNAEIVNELKSW